MRKELAVLIGLSWLAAGCGNLWGSDKPLAPPFAGLGSDGEYHSMLDVTRTRDMLVVFIHPDCEVGIDALRALEKIQTATGARRLGVLGVVAVPVSQFDLWHSKTSPAVPSIADADRRFAAAYKATVSPTFQFIKKGGELGRSWKGLSRATVSEIATEINPTKTVEFSPRSAKETGRSLTE